MNLTKEQEKAIQSGQPIELELAGTTCVILPKETYCELLDMDLSVRETYATVLKAIDADDENPDQYLEYLKDA